EARVGPQPVAGGVELLSVDAALALEVGQLGPEGVDRARGGVEGYVGRDSFARGVGRDGEAVVGEGLGTVGEDALDVALEAGGSAVPREDGAARAVGDERGEVADLERAAVEDGHGAGTPEGRAGGVELLRAEVARRAERARLMHEGEDDVRPVGVEVAGGVRAHRRREDDVGGPLRDPGGVELLEPRRRVLRPGYYGAAVTRARDLGRSDEGRRVRELDAGGAPGLCARGRDEGGRDLGARAAVVAEGEERAPGGVDAEAVVLRRGEATVGHEETVVGEDLVAG